MGQVGYLDARPLLPHTPVQLLELAKLPLVLQVLGHVARGELELDAPLGRLWPSLANIELRKLTLAQVLSHTAGCVEIMPPLDLVGNLQSLADLNAILDALERGKAIVRVIDVPGAKQQYHHFAFGWLLAGVLRANGLQLTSEPRPSDAADITNRWAGSDAEDLLTLFRFLSEFLDVVDEGKEKSTVDSKVFLGIFGRVHWLDPSAYREEIGFLPGAAGFSTARALAESLHAASRSLPTPLLRRATASARVLGASPVRIPESLDHFRAAEFGLGLEIVGQGYGHTNRAGSFALRYGRHTIACLLTRMDGDLMAVQDRLLAFL
jgi:hypothetical protein